MIKFTGYLAFCVVTVLSYSCSSTQNMSMNVQQPAPVSVPGYIKSVGIVNRSIADNQSKVADITDKLFSLEGANLDKEGAAAGMQGLSDELVRDNRFETVRIIPTPLTTMNPTLFPSPLTWDVIEKLCRENHTDAIFALELFDTDSKISYSANPVKLNTPLGNIPGIEHEASMRTLVKTGWRIYDPVSKSVLDEFPITRQVAFTGRGINPVVAANALIGRKDAVKQVGNQSGAAYAKRVVPYQVRVSRVYYVRGSDNFAIATRKARTGHWNEAAELWQRECNNPKRKIAGRACYNMAIINEINGNLDSAMGWAQKSYEDYNNRLALQYVHILNDRKYNAAVLKDQQSAMAMQQE